MSNQINKSFQLTVSDLSTSTRLDLFLSKKYNQYSRSQWSEQILNYKIKVNGKVVKPSTKINNHDVITGGLPVAISSNKLTAPDITPDIIFKNKDVIVINKPAGLLSHALSNKNADSVAGAFNSEVDDDDPLRSGIVHRLDKQTSGIMILARNPTTKKFLQEQFKARKVKKTYIALVHGHLQNDAARLELPITRSSNNPQKMIISKQGKPAISEYHTIKKYKDYTLISIKIMTGRTHQIRVQMAYIGNPVAGDMLYSNKKSLKGINRQFLHSSELTIELPSGTIKTFRAPLPDDLEDILKELA